MIMGGATIGVNIPHLTKVMGTGGSTQVTESTSFNTEFYCD